MTSMGSAQSIFENPITGTNPNTDNPYITGQTVDANMTVSGIGRGAGINPRNADNRYNANGWDTGAFDSTAYFEFTLTPNSGYEIDFTSFTYTGQASGTGPTNIVIRSSLDTYTADIGTPSLAGSTIDLSAGTYQNITSAITFRIYAWGASSASGTFSINDFVFNGLVRAFTTCVATTTWDGLAWDNGVPNATTVAILDGDYDTGTSGSFTTCRLTVNNGHTLTIDNSTYIEVVNDAMVNGGTISVATQGAFVQNDSNATFSIFDSGSATLSKTTRNYVDDGFHYTYWSSPVTAADLVTTFPNPDDERRTFFDGSNFLDQHTDGTTNGVPDDIDDNGDDWQAASGSMTPGYGYAITASAPPPVPGPINYADIANFTGGI